MTPPFIRKDKRQPPYFDQPMVEIEADTFEEFRALAERTHTSVKVAINSALNAWLGKI